MKNEASSRYKLANCRKRITRATLWLRRTGSTNGLSGSKRATHLILDLWTTVSWRSKCL